MSRLAGKRAIVTGGGSGIGRATCQALRRRGRDGRGRRPPRRARRGGRGGDRRHGGPGGRHRRRGRGADGRRRRPGRRARQQRRRRLRRRPARDQRGGVGHGRRRQPQVGVPVLEGRPAGDDRARLGRDREHHVRERDGLLRQRAVQRREGRPDQPDAQHGRALRQARDPRRRDRARHDPLAALAGARRQGAGDLRAARPLVPAGPRRRARGRRERGRVPRVRRRVVDQRRGAARRRRPARRQRADGARARRELLARRRG